MIEKNEVLIFIFLLGLVALNWPIIDIFYSNVFVYLFVFWFIYIILIAIFAHKTKNQD